jgi:hypothetical protein
MNEVTFRKLSETASIDYLTDTIFREWHSLCKEGIFKGLKYTSPFNFSAELSAQLPLYAFDNTI